MVRRGTESGTVDDELNGCDLDLRLIWDSWSNLPEAIRSGIMAMVKAAVRTTAQGIMRAEGKKPNEKSDNKLRGAAVSGVHEVVQGRAKGPDSSQTDDDLTRIVAAWPYLPLCCKKTLRGMVEAAVEQQVRDNQSEGKGTVSILLSPKLP